MNDKDPFISLLNLDPDLLPKEERLFYIAHRLGEREELHGFTQEERQWIARMLEQYLNAVGN